MCLAFRFSEELGLAPKGSAERATAHLRQVGLPTAINDIPGGRADPDELLRLMRQDKKVRHGKLTLILTRGIGQACIARDVSPEAVHAFLAREIGH